MPFFVRTYESEITQFIRELRKQDPQLEDKQRQGRERLWERNLDAQAQQEFKQARSPQRAYVYS